jgi:FAD/FMN-containing dehydrogenase
MPTRRQFLRAATGTAAGFAMAPRVHAASIQVNDIHSQLNSTRIDRVVAVDSEATLQAALSAARAEGKPLCVAGGRHAMGGQQFATDAVLLDTRPMQRIIGLDIERGVVEAEAGIQWPELVYGLIAMQQGRTLAWGIIQKQTGADRLTLGGALGANIHGRGLALRPIIGDIESFTLMDSDGNLRTCSRTENSNLFRLAIGGYGLLGIVTRVRLKLMRRTKLQRVVQIIDIDDLMPAIAEGYLYGDCQFSTDTSSDSYLRKGVFSCYRPLPPDAPIPAEQKELEEAQWRELYYLSHADTHRAYEAYSSYYLSTSGQRYWSDTSQLGVYIDDYHAELDRRLGAPHKGTEMITELYVPRPALPSFLAAVRADFRQHEVQLIYGTIRLIERDDESFLAWAREPWVCTVINLHVDHTEEGINKARVDFCRVIDRAIEYRGSYFLTYHRWASRVQVDACHPQMAEFLRLKMHHDPGEVFQSTWYRHYKQMFAERL